MLDQRELLVTLAAARLEMRYQPIVRLDNGAPVALEALARLHHPALGIMLPARFVPQIEDAGLAAELIELVAAAVFADMVSPAMAPLGLSVGLNLSLDVLVVPAVLDRLDAQRREAGLQAARIVLELTESQPVTDLARLRRATERVRAAGYRAVIDDLAPSVPLIAELMDLPFTGLKLDKALVQASADSRAAFGFVSNIVSAATARGLFVTAEGIEDVAAWRRMQALDVHLAQGFLVARPLMAAEVPGWIARWSGGTSLTLVTENCLLI